MQRLQVICQPTCPVPLYNNAIPLASQTQTIQMAYDDFRSLIYELSSFSLELRRPLTDWSQTAPYHIAFLALQGWRLVMTATFDHLFGDDRNRGQPLSGSTALFFVFSLRYGTWRAAAALDQCAQCSC